MNFSNSIPMSTQLLSKYESEDNDIRFTKVKIWLMHLGANRNASIFNKDVVEKAIPTLANTPIMASVGFNMFDNKDFEGHESDIEISENGELKFVNKTFPFGVIPENNNAKFETRLGDDMIEREYLTCEGILWNKWEDAVEIIYGKTELLVNLWNSLKTIKVFTMVNSLNLLSSNSLVHVCLVMMYYQL